MNRFGTVLQARQVKVGMVLLVSGACVFLSRLYVALLFYVASERILYHLPAIAPMATMAELVAQPEDYAGKWIRVRAEVWRRSEDEAILVPPGSGPEPPGIQTNDALFPKVHLYTHNFSADRVTSVSVLDLPSDRVVTIAGEFEPATALYPQHIDAVVIHDPVQPQHASGMSKRLLLHVSWLLLSALTGVVGAFFVVQGWRNARTI